MKETQSGGWAECTAVKVDVVVALPVGPCDLEKETSSFV